MSDFEAADLAESFPPQALTAHRGAFAREDLVAPDLVGGEDVPGAGRVFLHALAGNVQPPVPPTVQERAVTGERLAGQPFADPLGGWLAERAYQAATMRPGQAPRTLPTVPGVLSPEEAQQAQRPEALREAAGAEAHPAADWLGTWGPMLAPAAAGAAALGLKGARGPLRRYAERKAEKAMVTAFGAPAGVGELALQGEGRAGEVARTALREADLSGRLRPADIYRQMTEARTQRAGPLLGQLTAAAEARGARFRMDPVWDDFQKNLLPKMMKDPNQQRIAERVSEYLTEVARARGRVMSPAEAHEFRQNLDVFLRGAGGQQDPHGTLTKATFNELRHSVDRNLQQTMESAGLGAEWKAANRRFSNISEAEELAATGTQAQAAAAARPERPGTPLRVFGRKVPYVSIGGGPETTDRLRAYEKAAIRWEKRRRLLED